MTIAESVLITSPACDVSASSMGASPSTVIVSLHRANLQSEMDRADLRQILAYCRQNGDGF